MTALDAREAAGRIHIGTSGFSYAHWDGRFYPPGQPAAEALPFYARHFGTVELNTTFYRLPAEGAVARWAAVVPARFVFAVKGSRYLTHLKRLRDSGPGVERFFTAIRPLGRRRGPLLWQLPPQMKRDLPRLRDFLQSLPHQGWHVVEFRNAEWYASEVFDALADLRASLCLHDLLDAPAPFPPPGPLYYRRFHGANGKYGGRYGQARLRKPAAEVLALAEARTPCFAYFNNDANADAIADAQTLSSLVVEGRARDERLGPAP